MNQRRCFKSAPHLKPLSMRKTETVSILDIGTHKVVCLIAELQPKADMSRNQSRTHAVKLIGIGHQISAGIKGGIITDPKAAEHAIRHAVSSAERMANVEVRSILVNLSAGRIASLHGKGEITLNGPVRSQDIAHLHAVTCASLGNPARLLIHSLPTEYRLDNQPHISDPVGMVGDKLGVTMHLVSIDHAVAQNILMVVERCMLDVAAFTTSSYASGLATLSDDEMDMGCVLLDIGATTTNIGVFAQGQFVHADAFTMGGHHISMDIARGLTLRFSVAERLKITQGTAIWSHNDDRDIIPLPGLPDMAAQSENSGFIPKGRLSRIIQPRLEEILEFARNRLEQAGFSQQLRQRIVLTGGTSQMRRIDELAGKIMEGPARIGLPYGIKGLPAAAATPVFSVAGGLLFYPQYADREFFEHQRSINRYAATGTDHYLARFGRWLKDSF